MFGDMMSVSQGVRTDRSCLSVSRGHGGQKEDAGSGFCGRRQRGEMDAAGFSVVLSACLDQASPGSRHGVSLCPIRLTHSLHCLNQFELGFPILSTEKVLTAI